MQLGERGAPTPGENEVLTRVAFRVYGDTRVRIYKLYHRWAAENQDDDSMDAFVAFLCEHGEQGLTSVGVRKWNPDFTKGQI